MHLFHLKNNLVGMLGFVNLQTLLDKKKFVAIMTVFMLSNSSK